MMLMLVQWNKASCPHGEMLMALHHMHSLAYGVMSLLSSDRTGTASFIDAASYLVGYEGRRHGICIAYAL